MNRVILAIFVLMLSLPMALAQDTQDPSADSDSVGGNFSLRTFRGCLSRSGDQYELTVGGAVTRQYKLLGSNLAQLDGKARHMVSITGTTPEIPRSSAMSANATNAEGDTINFLSLDDLASTCSGSGGMNPATGTPYSSVVAAMAIEREPLTPSAIFIPMPEPQPQPGSFMIVPLVGALALGLLQMASYRREK